MSSTRLPGKVMMALCGRSVLSHVIERVSAAKTIDTVVVATTVMPEDETIAREAGNYKAHVFRGSLDDVLGRYYLAASEVHADTVVRVTSDCPLIDPDIIDAVAGRFLEERKAGRGYDYASNAIKPGHALGMAVEAFTFDALKRAYTEAREPFEREHVTPFIHMHPETFRILSLDDDPELAKYRLTLDTPEDFKLIEEVYNSLYRGRIFKSKEVVGLLRNHPELASINSHVRQKRLGE
jgi:spore coat polysaccharide biosynthesis protein SpsF